MQTGPILRDWPRRASVGRALWREAMGQMSGPISVVSVSQVLLPRLQTGLSLRWVALAIDTPYGHEIIARAGDCPLSLGERLTSRSTIGAGCLLIPCWFGGRQVATLVTCPQAGLDPDRLTALDDISDLLATVVQSSGQGPVADHRPLDTRLRTNRLSLLALLAAGLAHEVRNPLLVVRSYLDLIGDEIALLDDSPPPAGPGADTLERLRLFHGESVQAIRQAMAVLCDYRSIATETNQAEPIDPGRLCQDVVTMVRPAFGPELSLQLMGTVTSPVAAKRSHLMQIMLNLVINACQAAGPTGRVLISLADRAQDGTIAITVGNDGEPIPPHLLHGLFEPLITSKDEAGTGLGLAVSQALVQAMGGRIEAASRPGWTTFQVILPAVAAAAPQA